MSELGSSRASFEGDCPLTRQRTSFSTATLVVGEDDWRQSRTGLNEHEQGVALYETFINELPFDPGQLLGIPLALIGAVFLALGAQLQHRGAATVQTHSTVPRSSGLSVGQLASLLRRPSWLLGTALLGLAVLLQLASLHFSLLIIVQPLGVVALLVTAIVNARVSRTPLNRGSQMAIALCIGGVGLFVGVAAFTARGNDVTESQLTTILVLLAIVFAVFGTAFGLFRHRIRAIGYVLGAGVLYGFVATLAKSIINRITVGNVDVLTIMSVFAPIAAAALGGWFVQNAYASGPPDLVVAGLTVVDPLVAVGIGIGVLNEAAYAPNWAFVVFGAAACVAITGVFLLAKHHPQVTQEPATPAPVG